MVKNLPVNAGDMGSISWSRRIPRASGQLHPSAATTEAHAQSGARALRQRQPLQREAHTPQREAHTPQRGSSRCLWGLDTLMQQQRPSAAIKREVKKI